MSYLQQPLLLRPLILDHLLILVLFEVERILIGVPDAVGVGVLPWVIFKIFDILLVATVPHPGIVEAEVGPVTHHIIGAHCLPYILLARRLHLAHADIVAIIILNMLSIFTKCLVNIIVVFIAYA